MRIIIRQRLVAVAAATLASTLVAAPANAEITRVDDGADVPSLTDIRVVRAQHTENRVLVKVNFPDLRKDARASINFYVDTVAGKKGPEFVLPAPLFSGSDFALFRMTDWRVVGEPVRCDYGMTYRWQRDYVVFSAARGCFGRPDEVRIGLKMRDLADGSHPVTDWLNGRRKFTTWLASGPAA